MATEKLSPGMQQYVEVRNNTQMLFCFFEWVIFTSCSMKMQLMQRKF